MRPAAAAPVRPSLQRRPVGPAAAVWAVLRRELEARVLTGGYLWSTLVLTALAFLGPLLLPGRSTVDAVSTEGGNTRVLVALGFGLVIVFVIVLWGSTMAVDVVQEKATRVVEVVFAIVRPWQLLAGKTAALTVVGLVQVAVVLAGAFAGIRLFAAGYAVPVPEWRELIAGLVSIAIGVPSLAALMAAMAARVEHPEDLGSATQPVYLLLMAPFAGAVWAGLRAPSGLATHVLSIAPLTNIFAMPARLAAVPVPVWELILAAIVALATLAGTIWLAGRVYAGSILRAGGTVRLRNALARD